jgi:hypothetical protein
MTVEDEECLEELFDYLLRMEADSIPGDRGGSQVILNVQ